MAALGVLVVVTALSEGWLSKLRAWVSGVATQGAPADPFSQSVNPLTPIDVGKGGDILTAHWAGLPDVVLSGTYSGDGSMFYPSDTRFPAIPNAGTISSPRVPDSMLEAIYQLAGVPIPTASTARPIPRQ